MYTYTFSSLCLVAGTFGRYYIKKESFEITPHITIHNSITLFINCMFSPQLISNSMQPLVMTVSLFCQGTQCVPPSARITFDKLPSVLDISYFDSCVNVKILILHLKLIFRKFWGGFRDFCACKFQGSWVQQ